MVLATGDSDFSPVFRRLRELGKGVVGVGPASVLSASVTLSCHQFILTDSPGGYNNGSSKKKGKGGGRGATPPRGSARGALSSHMAHPPQLLAARGGFRINKPQSAAVNGPIRGGGNSRVLEPAEPGRTSPKRVGMPISLGEGAVGWVSKDPSHPPSLPPSVTPTVAEAAGSKGSGANETLLLPGQLLLPGMVTATTAANAVPPAESNPPSSRVSLTAAAQVSSGYGGKASPWLRGGSFGGGGGRGGRSGPAEFSGLGALSVIRPSEKLYRHLLALESTAEAGTGSLASDWGSGLSEVTLAKGLVSLANVCGGQVDDHRCAVESLRAVASGDANSAAAAAGGVWCDQAGLEREEALRVANLLQRCGLLSWVADEQQWLVTVPTDVEVLRRRRDDTMMEELLTRCQEAGVPFEPALASNLLWANKGQAQRG